MRHAGGYFYNEDYDLDKCVVCGVKMPNENEPTCSLECEQEREEREMKKEEKEEKIVHLNFELVVKESEFQEVKDELWQLLFQHKKVHGITWTKD